MTILPERRLDNWIASYLEFTKSHVAIEAFHYWTALGILSATVNSNRWMDAGHHTLYPNLYILFIGPPGIGKSSSSGIGIRILKDAKVKLNVFADSITAAGLIDFMSFATLTETSDSIVRTWTPAIVYASEIGTMLNTRNSLGELTTILTELFNKEDDWEARKATNHTKTIVKKPNVTFFACCYPEWLDENLTSTSLRSGFLGRMLIVQANKKRWKGSKPLSAANHLLRHDLIHDLSILSLYRGEMTWSPDAKVAFDKLVEEQPLDFSDAGQESMEVQGFISRKVQYVQRIAMLHAISDRSVRHIVRLEDFEFGLKQIEMCEFSTKRVKPKPQHVKNKLSVREKILHLVKKTNSDTIPIRKIIPYFYNKLSLEEVNKSIEELCAVGFCDLVGRKVKVLDMGAGE